MTHIFLAAAICWASLGVWLLCYWAPRCPMPANPCRQFILIAPLYHPDPWDEKKDEEDSSPPWWFSLGAYCIIIACMVWPICGWVVLLVVAMWMGHRFIQKITETGPYAHQQGGEQ